MKIWTEYMEIQGENNNNKNNNNERDEVKIMKKKNYSTKNRMETLQNAGIDTQNFFSANMVLPVGAMIQITMPGGATQTFSGQDNVMTTEKRDEIAESIIQNGYVRNTKLHRRWITAHTFRLLGDVTINTKRRYVPGAGVKDVYAYSSDWNKNFKEKYGYMYQFSMLLEELKVLSILEKEDKEAFEERSHFFTKEVVAALTKQYLRQLKKYIAKSRENRKRTCKGREYVRLAKYGDVFVDELQMKVYDKIEDMVNWFKYATTNNYVNYKDLYENFKVFCRLLNKLPYNTPKCSEWRDAFTGNGSFYSLKNICMFHQVNLEGCKTTEQSLDKLNKYLEEYKGEYWRFLKLLEKTVYDNNFDLAESIEAHK